MKFVLKIIAFWAFAASVSYGQKTGNDLLNQCRKMVVALETTQAQSPKDAYDSGVCIGFIEGVRGTLDYYGVSKLPAQACIRETVTNRQLMNLIVNYLNLNPQDLDKPAIELAIEPLRRAYPCK